MENCHICKQKIESDNVKKGALIYHLDCYINGFLNSGELSSVVSIAKKMRGIQQEYFKTRSFKVLAESKKVEKEIDETLEYFKPCPKCNKEQFSDMCFQFMCCIYCDYCIHASITGGICDFCGKKEK